MAVPNKYKIENFDFVIPNNADDLRRQIYIAKLASAYYEPGTAEASKFKLYQVALHSEYNDSMRPSNKIKADNYFNIDDVPYTQREVLSENISGDTITGGTSLKPSTLLDMIESSENIDGATREKFVKELDNYESLAKESAEEALSRQRQELDLWVQGEKNRLDQDMDTHQRELALKEAEQKTKRMLRFFDRDLVAVIIGGVLLLIISIALIFMIASEKVEPSLLENAFLILLGFFFGQGAARTGATTKKE